MSLQQSWAIPTRVCTQAVSSYLELRTGHLRIFLAETDTHLDAKVKVTPAMELRDNVEFLCTGPTYPYFLKKLLPIFLKTLEGPPVFISTSMIQVCEPVYGTSLAQLADRAIAVAELLPGNHPPPANEPFRCAQTIRGGSGGSLDELDQDRK